MQTATMPANPATAPTTPRHTVLHRTVMPGQICPYVLKAIDLLRRRGFTVEDRHLTTREATDAFKAEHGVKTLPQTFTDGARIGGYDNLRRHFGHGCATRTR